MNTNVKTCLFGGALIGAGLCSSATAGVVIWNYGNGNARDTVNDEVRFGYGWDADTGTGARSHAGSFGIDVLVDASTTPYNDAYAGAGGSFTVATDTWFSLSWNITDFGGIDISSVSDGTIVLESSGSGSLDFRFLATETYTLHVALLDIGGGAGFFSMGENNVNVVPLPPAAFGGLAMLAGLGAYRRVRR